MRRLTKSSPKLALGISVLLSLINCSVFVGGHPQWVWNPEANTAPSQIGGGGGAPNKVQFSGENSADKEKIPVEIVDTQARLFPQILSAISNSISGNRPSSGGSSSSSSSSSGGSGSGASPTPYPIVGGGGGSNGGNGGSGHGGGGSNSGTSASCNGGNCNIQCQGSAVGACIGSAIASQAIEQGAGAGNNIASNPSVFGNFLQNIFGGNGGASTLPAGIGNGLGGFGGGNSIRDPAGSCTCVDSNSCFLPSKPAGNCDGGSRVQCCSTTRSGTRTVFPDEYYDRDRYQSNGVRTVTRSQIRRQLFRNIVRGSGSIIDDTLDLVLTPFLTKEDQVRVATRLIRDSY